MLSISDGTTALEALKHQLDEIVRHLKADYEVWKSCHISGCPLVDDMARTHGKCLTKLKNLEKFMTTHALKRERALLQRLRRWLKVPSERLVWLVDRLLDATEHTRESLKILRGLRNNKNLSDKIIYRTWKLRHLLEFTETVMRLYDAEYEIKEMVVEELVNSKNREELAFIRQAWREPGHALTPEFTTMFTEFELETSEV